ncbi:MAG TPA: ATP-dependent RecD-like DNA helicase [Vicinamibacterales bacterium]
MKPLHPTPLRRPDASGGAEPHQPRLLDAPAPGDHLAGTVERVTFHNEENGFSVLRVQVRGRRELVTLVGHAASISAGEFVQAEGSWQNDRQHGVQFSARVLNAVAPTTVEGIEKYLGSGLIKGIGPHFAKRLVGAFGTAVFDVIDGGPERLRTVEGIGPVRAQRMVEAWRDQKAVREIMVFLHSHGVGTSRAVRIFKTYGPDAIAIISENPYRLAADIRGIGFLTADRIAGTLGVEKTSMIRARAGIGYTLTEAMDEGHCGLPLADLHGAASRLLEIPQALVAEALDLETAGGTVVHDTVDGAPCVFLSGLYAAERTIAARLRALAAGHVPWKPIDTARAVPWVEAQLGMTLAAMQAEAVRLAATSKVLVITGGPGVGKTTLLNAILTVLRVRGVRLALCAPTGRAAKRMSETTGLEAKTIHRTLEVDPRSGGFRRQESNLLECDLLVVDETSMVDVPLMHALLRAVPPHAAVILVGDVDQLPSVGPGQVLADIIDSAAVPVVRLTEVFRQASESRIIVNAHRINRGELPEVTAGATDSDFYFSEIDEPEQGVRRLLQIVHERIPARFGLDPIRDVQVLCPMNRGALGARALNLELQQLLNPGREARIERFGWTFSVGDKVMQVENDYDRDVYNGDVGFITALDPDRAELVVDFDGRAVPYDCSDLDRLVLAYATTVHKSQGSEYPAVVMPVATEHYPMLQRNLLYTGVTRGKRLVVIVGQRKALAIAVSGRQARRRWSKLKEWMQADGPHLTRRAFGC